MKLIALRPCLCHVHLVAHNFMFHVNMFEHSGTNAFKTAGVLRQLYKRGVFSHSGVISTEHGRSDL